MDGIATTEHAQSLLAAARRVMPGGTFGNFPAEVIIREGSGAHVRDIHGREYIDYLLGSGPMFVGHAHPEVTAAVREQIAAGHHVLRQQRARHPPGRGDRGGGALRGAGALRLLRPEADLYAMRVARAFRAARQDPEVRGRLPRHERLRPDEPGAQAPRELPRGRARLPPASPTRCATRCWSPRSTMLEAAVRLIEAQREEIWRRHRRALPAADPARSRASWKACGR